MQNLQEELIKLLEKVDNYTVDGQLNKTIIVEAALKVDPTLIGLLIKSDTFKKHFFKEVEGVLVFDKIEFQRFVNNKSFLPDSYTAFKNKIGLTINDESLDNYITSRNDVVLAWPHKDCVLEGGQTKEDQKRNEIFWNETLAPDNVDRLLSPKAFTNFKRYEAVKSTKKEKSEGLGLETESDALVIKETELNSKENIDFSNENLIIKGNNLLALASLLKTHRGKIKLIYIDPPFNTGNDSFQYNDNFNHSTWLTFMKNRLFYAKELLKDDGIIFINVDAIEEAYLKVLCDEIFTIDNFINVIAVKSSTPSGTKTAHKEKTIIKQKDLILVYRKSRLTTITPQYTVRNKWDSHYSNFLINEKGKYKLKKLTEVLLEKGVINKKTSISNIDMADKSFKQFYLSNAENICRLQSHKNKEAEKISREKGNVVYEHKVNGITQGLYFNGQVITPLKQGIHKVYKNQKFSNDLGMLLCDFWSDIDFQNTQNEGGVSFPTAKKPEFLISRIIEMGSKEGDIVLDFNLGSGTTAAVALKANRKFIGIEQMDYGSNDSTQRLNNVLLGEKSGVSKAYNWKGGGAFTYLEIMPFNQTYIDKIQAAKTKEDLLSTWQEMKEKAMLSYLFNADLFDERLDAFKTASLEDMKKYLIEILDKNQLYVNYSEIEDNDYQVSPEDIALNHQFYKKK